MIVTSLLAASALAVQAGAFLVVPVDESVSNDYHLNTFKDPKTEIATLPCTGCPLAQGSSTELTWVDGVDNALSLNFTIDDENNAILLNGRHFYPMHFPVPLDLYAPQVQTADDGTAHPEVHLGFALETYPPIQDAAGTSLTPIQFTIVALEGKPVNIDTVEIKLLKLRSGELFFGSLELIPAPEEAPGKDCPNQICRIRAIILSRIRAMLEAAKARAHKAGTMIKSGCHKMRPHHKGHKEHKEDHKNAHHKHHKHHKHHGHLMRFIHRSMRLFVIPAMLGIVGGLVASIVGMLVGQTLVYLWVRFVRGGQRGQHGRIALAEEAEEPEKEPLVEGEAPPDYEDVEDGITGAQDQKR